MDNFSRCILADYNRYNGLPSPQQLQMKGSRQSSAYPLQTLAEKIRFVCCFNCLLYV